MADSLGEASVDVYADLSRLDSDFRSARAKTEAFTKDLSGKMGKAGKEAANAVKEVDRATRSLASAYSPVHAAMIRHIDDLDKIQILQKSGQVTAAELAMFTRKAGEAYEHVINSQSKMYRFGEKIGKQIREWGVLMATGAAAGAIALIDHSLKSSKAIDETAKKLGMSAEAWQKWTYVAQQSGVETGHLEVGFKFLQTSMGRAAAGASREGAIFERLGINLKDAGGHAKNTDTVMRELSDALLRIADKNQRAAVATILLGQTYQDMVPALSGGTQHINALGDAAERLGIILSNEQIAKAGEAAQKFEDLKKVLSARIDSIVADNAGAIIKLSDKVLTLSGAMGDLFSILEKFKGTTIGSIFGELPNLNPTVEGLNVLVATLKQLHDFMPGPTAASAAHPTDAQRSSGEAVARQLHPEWYKGSPAPAAGPGGKPIDVSDLLAPKGSQTRSKAQVLADFESELRVRGIKVISDVRTAAQQHAEFLAGHTPLDGYKRLSRHQSMEAVDVDKRTHSDEKASEAAQAAGLKGFEIVTESGGRKHYEWKGAGKKGEVDVAGSEADAKREAAEVKRLANERLRQQKRFESQLSSFQDDELRAQLSEATDAETIAKIKTEQVNREHDRYDEQVKLGVAMNELTAPQAKALKAANEEQRGLDLKRVDREKTHAITQRSIELSSATIDAEVEVLHGAEDLAKTNDERSRIEAEILDKTFEQKRTQLLSISTDETIDKTKRAIADVQLKSLDELEIQAREAHRRAAMNPIEKFYDALNRTTKQIDELYQDFAAQKLEDRISRSGQMADDIASAFGDVARGVLDLKDPISLLKSLLGDLAKTMTEEVLIRPFENMIREKIGAPIAERVTGAGAHPGGVTDKEWNAAIARNKPMIDAMGKAAADTQQPLTSLATAAEGTEHPLASLAAAAESAANALSSIQPAGGSSAIDNALGRDSSGSDTSIGDEITVTGYGKPKAIKDILDEPAIGSENLSDTISKLGDAATQTTGQLAKFGGALPQVLQQILSSIPTGGGGGGGGILGTILHVASAVAGSRISAGGIARSNLTVGSTIAANPSIFHDGGEIGPDAQPIRRPLRAGERNITALVGERVIRQGPSKKFGDMLDTINAGKLPRAPNMGMALASLRGGDSNHTLALSLGGIHVHGNQDDRSARQSGKQAASVIQSQVARAVKQGILSHDR